jgi:DNA-3-methyladenine glycosylase
MSTPFEKEALEALMRGYAHGLSHGSASFKNNGEVKEPMSIDTKLGRDFFAKPAVDVAYGLLGREIVRRFNGTDVKGVIVEVSAWEGTTPSSSDGMRYAPGTIGVSTKFGKHLLDIATELKDVSSCVTLIAAEFDWNGKKQVVQGPGLVTAALKIDRSFDQQKIYENPNVYIIGGHMPAQDVLKRDKKGVPANCKGYFYLKR